tara:strand:- start:2083 stop:2295 length:213 start_codon:yes stop_codon:yes gene_type:complete
MNQNINIDLKTVENIKCDECSGYTFEPVFVIKHLSALVSPNGKETVMPFQVFKCASCGHINEKFLEGLTN